MNDGKASTEKKKNKWRPGVINYVKRFFSNQTSNKFISNPFKYGGIFEEEDGHLRRKEKKVGFLELFYDLFFVAALSLFSRESSLTEGELAHSFLRYLSAPSYSSSSVTLLYANAFDSHVLGLFLTLKETLSR